MRWRKAYIIKSNLANCQTHASQEPTWPRWHGALFKQKNDTIFFTFFFIFYSSLSRHTMAARCGAVFYLPMFVLFLAGVDIFNAFILTSSETGRCSFAIQYLILIVQAQGLDFLALSDDNGHNSGSHIIHSYHNVYKYVSRWHCGRCLATPRGYLEQRIVHNGWKFGSYKAVRNPSFRIGYFYDNKCIVMRGIVPVALCGSEFAKLELSQSCANERRPRPPLGNNLFLHEAFEKAKIRWLFPRRHTSVQS